MKTFEKEAIKAGMNQEIIDDIMNVDGEVGQEADDVYNEIIGEMGM